MEEDRRCVLIEEKISNAFGQMGIKKYRKQKFLGKGGFAECYELVSEETKQVFAGKIIDKKSLTKTRQKMKVILILVDERN